MDADNNNQVTMPKWPAWIMLATMALCAYPALTASAPRAEAAPVEVSRVTAAEKRAAPISAKSNAPAKVEIAAN